MARLPRRALAVLVLLAAPAAAGDPFTIGPLGGSAGAVAIDPATGDVLVITFPEGLQRSTDGGATFAPWGAGLPANPNDLVTDPALPQRLYTLAGTKVWRSEDFGANWAPLALNAPANLERLAIASDGTLLAGTGTSVHRSDTDGASWTLSASGIVILSDLAFAPSDSSLAFYGSLNGVFKSVDGGTSFADPGPFSTWTKALAVDPADPLVVFAGTTTGVQRSLDGGATFAPASTGLPGGTSAQLMRYDPAGTTLWLGALEGVHVTTDGGDSWSDANAGFPDHPPISLALAFGLDGDVWLGNEASGGGLWRLPGAVLPWIHVAFAKEPIHDVLFAGSPRAVGLYNGVWAGAPGEVVGSTAWQFDFGTDTRALVADPADATRWLAGGVGAFIDNANIGLLTGNGATGTLVYERFGAGHVRDLAFDPFSPGVVLAGLYPASFGNEGIARSANSGSTWTDVPGTVGWSCVAIAHDPFTPGRVLALLGNNQWLHSTNGGQSWAIHPAFSPGTGNAAFLAFDPWTPSTLYRGDWGPGANNGAYVSTNAGMSWTPLGPKVHVENRLQTHPDAPGLLWLSDNGGALLVSGDGGTTWQTEFSAPDGDVTAIALETSTGDLLVGTTAASAWELPGASPYVRLGLGTAGTDGLLPRHFAHGALPQPGAAGWALGADRLLGGSTAFLLIGLLEGALPLWGGTLFVAPPWLTLLALPTGGTAGAGGSGAIDVNLPLPNEPLLVGLPIVSQVVVNDRAATANRALSNGLRTTFMP